MGLTGAAQRKVIVRTALILAGLTAFEFFIAFTWRGFAGMTGMELETVRVMKNALFIILTIFKAFYIVGEFMHLKHEVKRLIYVILVPFIFIVWLLIALFYEGDKIGEQSPGNASIEHLDHPEVIEEPENLEIYA